MRHLPKLLALLIFTNTLSISTKAALPPGTLDIIKENKEVCLDLGGQALSPEDIKGLGEMLESNTSIKTLILAHNYLDNSCEEEIKSILCSNNTLTELDLSGNFISERRITNAIEFAKKLGIKWERKARNKFCLERISGIKGLVQRPASEDLDDSPLALNRGNLGIWRKNQKAKDQERELYRTEKELDQGKIYDQE